MNIQEEILSVVGEMREVFHKISDGDIPYNGISTEMDEHLSRLESIANSAQGEAEPVAWMFTDNYGTHFTEEKKDWYDAVGIESVTPLYTAPPADSAQVLVDALDRIGDMASTIKYVCENIGIKADGVKSIYDLAGLIADVAAHKSEVKG